MTIFLLFFMGGFNMMQIVTTYQTVKEGIKASKQLYSLIEKPQKPPTFDELEPN